MPCNRRQFVRHSTQGILTAAVFGSRVCAEPVASPAVAEGKLRQLPIVDTHQHLWDLDKFRLPWLKPGEPLCRSHLPEHYREAARGLNIVKSVYMEVNLVEEQHVAEAEYLIELCRGDQEPTCAAVIGGRPGEERFRQYIRRFQSNRYVKGVRQVLFQAQPERPFFLEPAYVSGVRLLGEVGMSFDLCLPAAMLRAGIELVDKCPATRFILDHCGNADVKVFRAAFSRDSDDRARQQGNTDGTRNVPATERVEQWRRDMAELAKRRNVVCKISGIIATVQPTLWSAADLAPIVGHCLDCFGPDRVMFGGDWPVCTRGGATLRRWVEVLTEIVRGRPEADRRKLFAENAVAFYGL
jgi:L-fuconolactonase